MQKHCTSKLRIESFGSKESKKKFPHHLEDGGVSLIDEPLILMSSLPIESSAMNLARGRSIGIVSDRHASVMACLNFGGLPLPSFKQKHRGATQATQSQLYRQHNTARKNRIAMRVTWLPQPSCSLSSVKSSPQTDVNQRRPSLEMEGMKEKNSWFVTL